MPLDFFETSTFFLRVPANNKFYYKLLLAGSGCYWPEGFRTITCYWPEGLRIITCYWPEGLRTITSSLNSTKFEWLLVTSPVYSTTTRQWLAYWPVWYHLFIDNFRLKVFRQIRCYLPEHLRIITSSQKKTIDNFDKMRLTKRKTLTCKQYYLLKLPESSLVHWGNETLFYLNNTTQNLHLPNYCFATVCCLSPPACCLSPGH